MAVITISRQFGAGGWTLGEKLAKRFGYHCVHEDMIKKVAAKAKVSSDRVLAIEGRGSDKLMTFLNKFVKPSYVDRLTSEKYGSVDEKTYVESVRAIVQNLYEQGDTVIIGRGGQYILKGLSNAFHLLLVADLEHRIRFVMKKYRLGDNEAEKAIKKRDQTRARFLDLFAANQSHDDPVLYHMVLNMSRLTMEGAEHLVTDLVFP
jgi:cytidylate kinase